MAAKWFLFVVCALSLIILIALIVWFVLFVVRGTRQYRRMAARIGARRNDVERKRAQAIQGARLVNHKINVAKLRKETRLGGSFHCGAVADSCVGGDCSSSNDSGGGND